MPKVINLLEQEPIQLIFLVNTESETLTTKCLDVLHWDAIQLIARDVDGFDIITVTRGDKKFVALGYWNDGAVKLPF